MTQLTPHFTLEELIYSDTANKLKINNTPNNTEKENLKTLCVQVLEPLRDILNKYYMKWYPNQVKQVSLNVSSGFRNKELNNKVGGKDTSSHRYGLAADINATIYFKNGTKKDVLYTDLYKIIKCATRDGRLSVDQCIAEKSGKILWCHVGYKSKQNNRKQFLIYKNGVYTLDK